MEENFFFVFFDALSFFPFGFCKYVQRCLKWQCAELSGIFQSDIYDSFVLQDFQGKAELLLVKVQSFSYFSCFLRAFSCEVNVDFSFSL